ncbi:hypothetical protein FACS1894202_09880 [Clostridia bacterium]|nr:hypothetical protein FACS1894202_09880 [Clostridia bacterium]
MLTNLDWLMPGKQFPPPEEKTRLDTYGQNENLFLSRHTEVWREAFDRAARLLRKRNRDVSTVLNYHQLLSKKTADLICGEPPKLEYEGETDKLDALLRNQRFSAKLYELMIDVSRYGNAVVKLVDNRVTVVSPRCWFPIVDSRDLKNVMSHVIAYPLSDTVLYTEIHTPGNIERRRYRLERNLIGGLLESGKYEPTGQSNLAVQALTNVTHSGSIYGLDDYTIINSLLEKLMWRLHCADTILDKHSEPSISGPSSALTMDERTGLWLFSAGNYFKRDVAEDPTVQYITWDGNLEANFREIELLTNQLYILSEMGAAFLEGGDEGAASSGTALKLRLVSPRIKAQRLVGLNDATVRDIIAMLGTANGIAVNANDLQLIWHDGLPDDPVEDANRRNVETGGKPTKSQYAAIKERGLSDAETEAELEQIRKESAVSAPSLFALDPTPEDMTDDED